MKQELEFFDVSGLPWKEIGPGLAEKTLAGEPGTPAHTRLLRFDPGTVTSETLTHDFWEELWILEGSLTDLRLEQTFTAGMYACRPPGMEHGPWRTEDGCITFEVRYPDEGGK
jgi:hypothetical protein